MRDIQTLPRILAEHGYVTWQGEVNGVCLRSGPQFFSWDVDTVETMLFHCVVDPRSEQNLSRDQA